MQRVTDHNFFVKNFLNDHDCFWVAGRMLHIHLLDRSDRLAVVEYFGPGLDQGVKHNIPVEVDDAHPSQSFAFLS